LNLQRRCRKCHEFFPVKPMELKFFCDKKECQEYFNDYHFFTIKSQRYIRMDYFDIYDLDRVISSNNHNYISYERVCRVCGEPLFNKDGKYSYHRRYCGNHTGYELWAKYNWGIISKNYARDVADKNKEIISNKFLEHIQANYSFYKEKPNRIKRDLRVSVICEVCFKLCLIYDVYWDYRKKHFDVINIHHKIPIHKITMDNIHLIWDYSNLIALCKDCHNKQDHQLKTKVDPYIKFKKITEFLEVD